MTKSEIIISKPADKAGVIFYKKYSTKLFDAINIVIV